MATNKRCVSSGVSLRHIKPGELTEWSRPGVRWVLKASFCEGYGKFFKGFQSSFERNQSLFPRNTLRLIVLFILLNSKWNFWPSWENKACIFHSDITFCFTFQMRIMKKNTFGYLEGNNKIPVFWFKNKEKFELHILLCFHFKAQIQVKLKKNPKNNFVWKADVKHYDF